MTAQLPAYLQPGRTSSIASRALANVGLGSPPYISIRNNSFTLVDAGGNEQLCTGQKLVVDGVEYLIGGVHPELGAYLDVVVVDVSDVTCKVYYDTQYDPGASSYLPPTCWSDNGEAPSRNASRKIAYEHGVATCAACPMNQWGSAVSRLTGEGIKACVDIEKVACIVPGMPGILFLLRLPPGSRTNWRAYMAQYNGQEVGPESIVTRISFDRRAVGILQFQAVSYADQGSYLAVVKAQDTKATDGLVGRLDQKAPFALPAPAQQAPQVTYQPQQTMPTQPAQPAQTFGQFSPAQGVAPGQPGGGFAAGSAAPQQTQQVGPAFTGQPMQQAAATQAPTPRRRGRPKTPDAAAPATGQMQQGPAATAAPPPTAAGPAPSTPAQQQTPFAGMVAQPASPPADLQSNLQNFFAQNQ